MPDVSRSRRALAPAWHALAGSWGWVPPLGTLIVLLAAAAILAACAHRDLTPQQQVYELQRELDVALEEVEAYAAQPPCNPDLGIVVACHHPDALAAAVRAGEEADTALDQAEAVVRAGGTDVSVYLNLARAALLRISAELAKKGALT